MITNLVKTTKRTMSTPHISALDVAKPTSPAIGVLLSTKYPHEDLGNGIKDEFGALYSADGKRLLRGSAEVESCEIRQSTGVICDRAFKFLEFLSSIILPSSIIAIGNHAFCGCESLTSITLPSSITFIGNYAFDNCNSLKHIYIPDGTREQFERLLLEYFHDKLCIRPIEP